MNKTINLLIVLASLFSIVLMSNKANGQGMPIEALNPIHTQTPEQQVETCKRQIQQELIPALNRYYSDVGVYPTSEEGLSALVAKPSIDPIPEDWGGPYLMMPPKDIWGNGFIYRSPGRHNKDGYDLSSYGPDGVKSKDDITNWN
ncbi:type II secretion system protein GspG [Candidatus Omnitrophota bacterium]